MSCSSERFMQKVETNVRGRVFNAGLLARSQFASGSSCDRPTRSRFSVGFLHPRANAELVFKFHIALHASYAAHAVVTLQIWSYINVTLSLRWDSNIRSWILRDSNQCVIALQITDPSSRQRGHPTWRIKKAIVKQMKLLWARHEDELVNWPLSLYNLNLNLKVQVNLMSGGITGPPCSWAI
jgi:hypothetical protein